MTFASAISIDISPENMEQDLAGFSRRQSSQEQIGQKELYVRIVWLENDSDPVLFIALDTLYFPVEIAEKIDCYCVENFGIRKNNIIYSATHTHSAPSIALRHFGKIDQLYVRMIEDKIVEGIKYCSENREKAHLEIRNFPAGDKIIGRRRIGRDVRSFFLRKRMLRLPNEKQKIDTDIRSIRVISETGECVTTMLNFSCHPVIANTSCYSSDFPGHIAQKISEEFGGVVVFLQGFCGDMRPNLTTEKVPLLKIIDYCKIIFNKKIFKVPNKDDFHGFCDDLIERVINAHKISTAPALNLKTKSLSFEHEIISQSGNTTEMVHVKIIMMGKFIFVSIPAEVNSKYIIELKKYFSDYKVFPLGYAEGMIGYLPFHNEIAEGGYEVNSARNYGWDTPFSIQTTKGFYAKLVKKIEKIIKTN